VKKLCAALAVLLVVLLGAVAATAILDGAVRGVRISVAVRQQ
jgi:hypothetical protein